MSGLAETHRVIAPSLPGIPGATGHEDLDTIFDSIRATHDILDAAGLADGDPLAVSVSGALAAEVSGVWPRLVRRLLLLAPAGLCDPHKPWADIWAQRPEHMNDPVCLDGDTYGDFIERPEGVDATQSKIEQMRALKASARFLLPPGANGLAKRLRRPRHARVLSGALRGCSQRACPSSGNY